MRILNHTSYELPSTILMIGPRSISRVYNVTYQSPYTVSTPFWLTRNIYRGSYEAGSKLIDRLASLAVFCTFDGLGFLVKKLAGDEKGALIRMGLLGHPAG